MLDPPLLRRPPSHRTPAMNPCCFWRWRLGDVALLTCTTQCLSFHPPPPPPPTPLLRLLASLVGAAGTSPLQRTPPWCPSPCWPRARAEPSPHTLRLARSPCVHRAAPPPSALALALLPQGRRGAVQEAVAGTSTHRQCPSHWASGVVCSVHRVRVVCSVRRVRVLRCRQLGSHAFLGAGLRVMLVGWVMLTRWAIFCHAVEENGV